VVVVVDLNQTLLVLLVDREVGQVDQLLLEVLELPIKEIMEELEQVMLVQVVAVVELEQ
tara:strand:+ start:4 stop:180 length:177 start_codon:yes stop_codon:yes gene_type:complete